MRHLLAELDTLKSLLRDIVDAYVGRLDGEVGQIADAVRRLAAEDDLTPSHHRDIRDMLAQIRSLQTKPEKGRRKDIKKIDDLIGEIHSVAEKW